MIVKTKAKGLFAFLLPRWWLFLFFAVLLALGFLTASQYGQPWDERSEMDILRMNAWEYQNALGLDDSAVRAMANEEPHGAGYQREVPLTPISQSIERDHGQSAYYPLFSVVMDASVTEAERMEIWHHYTWVLFWIGAVALYFCCRHMGMTRICSCMAVLMLCLSPRFFAEGHYNNKDIVLMSLTLLTLAQALALMRRPSMLRALCFGLVGALAANTKIAGLALWGLCGIAVTVQLALQKRLDGKALRAGLCAIGSFVLFYALLTPALWANPMAYFSYGIQNAAGFTRWGHTVLFRGALFDTSIHPLPWYYLPYMILTTTPLWILLLLVIGQSAAIVRICRRIPSDGRVPLALCTALWLLPLLFAVVSQTPVYNGWRHFYFLYGPMLVLAAHGLNWFWEHALHRVKRWQSHLRHAAIALLGLCMLTTGADMVLNHPHQYVYYNALVSKQDINDYLERDYWNVSVLGALEQLSRLDMIQSAEQASTISGVNLWAQDALAKGLMLLEDNPLTLVNGEEETADYWLVNHTYSRPNPWIKTDTMYPVLQILAYGQPLVTLYECASAP